MRGRSDSQLERTVGSGPGLGIVFKAMEQAFVPERARGFQGEILYELVASDGTRRWTVRIEDGRAVAEQRAADEPAVTMKTRLPTFIRIAARELNPARAMLDGELEISGDFAVAGRLGEMFGGEPQW